VVQAQILKIVKFRIQPPFLDYLAPILCKHVGLGAAMVNLSFTVYLYQLVLACQLLFATPVGYGLEKVIQNFSNFTVLSYSF